MKVIFALLTVAVAALAQDTHFCPDNWELHVSLFFIKFLISPKTSWFQYNLDGIDIYG